MAAYWVARPLERPRDTAPEDLHHSLGRDLRLRDFCKPARPWSISRNR